MSTFGSIIFAIGVISPTAPPMGAREDDPMQTYKHKSNARRAARASGLDPETTVKERDGLFYLERPAGIPDDGMDIPEILMIPQEERKEAWAKAPPKRSAAAAQEIIMPKAKSARARKAAKVAKTGNKNDLLVSLLKGKGATMEQITKATGWLPHTARARISGLKKAPLKMKVEHSRDDGVTSYRIAA